MAEPKIERIVRPLITPGTPVFIEEGEAVSAAQPGTLLMIAGSAFGADAASAVCRLGETPVAVMPTPLFGDTRILFTVPDLTPGTVMVRVSVGGVASNGFPLTIEPRPPRPGPPGTLIGRLLTTLDAHAALLSAEVRLAEYGDLAPADLKERLADTILESRQSILKSREVLGRAPDMGDDLVSLLGIENEAAKEQIRAAGRRMAERNLLFCDDLVESTGILGYVDEINTLIRQGGRGKVSRMLEIVGDTAGGIKDFAAALESGADALRVSGNASAGVGVEAGADADTNPFVAVAALLSGGAAIGEGCAKVIANLVGWFDERAQHEEDAKHRGAVTTSFGKLETKLDGTVTPALVKLETKFDGTVTPALMKLESKLDSTVTPGIAKLEAKLDRTMTSTLQRIERKIDKNELKKDKIEVKLDRMEQKLDWNEIKKDRIEAKLDKLEPKVDRLETKADRQEQKMDRLEGKADKAETKLDKLEPKGDKAELKLDRLETKSDQIQVRLKQLELDLKLLEQKADKGEAKLDQLRGITGKIGVDVEKTEGKLDKLENKLDKASAMTP